MYVQSMCIKCITNLILGLASPLELGVDINVLILGGGISFSLIGTLNVSLPIHFQYGHQGAWPKKSSKCYNLVMTCNACVWYLLYMPNSSLLTLPAWPPEGMTQKLSSVTA
jgi:hypothetical protein